MENVYVLNNNVAETSVKEDSFWTRFKKYFMDNAFLIMSGLRFASGNYTMTYLDYQNLS